MEAHEDDWEDGSKAPPQPTDSEKVTHARMGWRVAVSSIGGVGWLAFVIIWLFFYADDYSGYQNVAIILLSVVAVTAVAGLPWAICGRCKQTGKEAALQQTEGFQWRVVVSAVVALGMVIFLIVWLFFYADGYSIYQNVAVVLVAILLMGGLQGALWAPWGMRHGSEFE